MKKEKPAETSNAGDIADILVGEYKWKNRIYAQEFSIVYRGELIYQNSDLRGGDTKRQCQEAADFIAEKILKNNIPAYQIDNGFRIVEWNAKKKDLMPCLKLPKNELKVFSEVLEENFVYGRANR